MMKTSKQFMWTGLFKG